MRKTTLIKHFKEYSTVVTEKLLKEALDLYEISLERVVNNPPKNNNTSIPGFEEFNLCDSIVHEYYRQNPGFDYRDIREGFTPEQIKTLANIQGDEESFKLWEKKKELKKYSSYY